MVKTSDETPEIVEEVLADEEQVATGEGSFM